MNIIMYAFIRLNLLITIKAPSVLGFYNLPVDFLYNSTQKHSPFLHSVASVLFLGNGSESSNLNQS